MEGNESSGLLHKNWKEFFDSGKIIPTKMRFCNECNVKKVCNKCDNQINGNKEFEANLNFLKRQPPKKFGSKLPYFTE